MTLSNDCKHIMSLDDALPDCLGQDQQLLGNGVPRLQSLKAGLHNPTQVFNKLVSKGCENRP